MESIAQGIAEGRVVVRRYLAKQWSVTPDEAQARIDRWAEDHPNPNDPPTDRSFDSRKFTADDIRQHHLQTRDRFRPQVTIHTTKPHRDVDGTEREHNFNF